MVISGKRGGAASAFSVGTLRSSMSHKRLRSLHSRRLLQNGVPTPLSSRSVNSASRRRPTRLLRRTRRFASVCGGDALGDRHLGPVPQPPAVIRFGIRSPLHQHPLPADAPPCSGACAGVARLSRVPGACAMVEKHAQAKRKTGFGARVPKLSALAALPACVLTGCHTTGLASSNTGRPLMG